MKRKGITLIIGFIMAGMLSGCAGMEGFKLEGKAIGHCRLINVAIGRDLYNGSCTIKETIDADKTRFAIRMGYAEPYVFVKRGGYWEFVDRSGVHQPARFRDRSHHGVFRWGDFRLEVDDFD